MVVFARFVLGVALLMQVAIAEDALAFPAIPPLGKRTIMSWDVHDSITVKNVAEKKRMRADKSVSRFQLFLPKSWDETRTYPMIIFLHGSGDGTFDVMNSQSLPRLLSPDQSTSLDRRSTWSFNFRGQRYSNGTFADDFDFVVLMPQGWDSSKVNTRDGWSRSRLERVNALAQAVAKQYSVDTDRISLTGQSAGGVGAYAFAMQHPTVLAALVPVCGGVPSRLEQAAERLARLPVWVFHAANDIAMPVYLSDQAVSALNKAGERSRAVLYTRYDAAPAPPDPKYSDMRGHASYDLAFRDEALYAWLRTQSRLGNIMARPILYTTPPKPKINRRRIRRAHHHRLAALGAAPAQADQPPADDAGNIDDDPAD